MNKNKSKILYIVTQGHWGGAQKYIYDLATSLSSSFDITVAVGEPDNNPDLQKSLKDAGIKHVQLQHLRRAISPIHDLLAIFELKKLYKKLKPGTIHLNSSKVSILGSVAASKLKPKRNYHLIYTVHGWVFNEPLSKFKKNLYKRLEEWTSKKKNKIIVLSEDEKRIAIEELKIPKDKLKIIPPGIEHPKHILDLPTGRNKLKLFLSEIPEAKWKEAYVLGTVANLYKTKNLDNLIKAVDKIKEKLGNFYLILIGEGSERKKLENLIKEYKLEKNVYLTGFLKDTMKNQYVSAFNVFVLPSKKEGLPYTILEAKMNNVPIIATNVGAISTIIENKKTGLIVPSGNVDKLAEAILYAYQNKDEMHTMAKTGHCDNFKTYLKQNMVKETTLVYHHLPPHASLKY